MDHNRTRRFRCDRCIKFHKHCNGVRPVCGTCASIKQLREACTYDPSMPTRREKQKIGKEKGKQKMSADGAEDEVLGNVQVTDDASGRTAGEPAPRSSHTRKLRLALMVGGNADSQHNATAVAEDTDFELPNFKPDFSDKSDEALRQIGKNLAESVMASMPKYGPVPEDATEEDLKMVMDALMPEFDKMFERLKGKAQKGEGTAS